MRLIAVTVAMVLASSLLQAAIIHVPGDQPTIQAGIDAATEYSDTVVVADGVYTGSGNHDIDFGGRAVVLKSENGPEATIIDCQGGVTNPRRGFIFNSGEDFTTIVEGFTIRGGYMYIDDTTITHGGGIRCESASPTIVSCVVENCWAMMGGGLSCTSASPRLVDCIVRSNYAYLWGGGLECSQSSPVLSGCQFVSDSSRHSGGAIYSRLTPIRRLPAAVSKPAIPGAATAASTASSIAVRPSRTPSLCATSASIPMAWYFIAHARRLSPTVPSSATASIAVAPLHRS